MWETELLKAEQEAQGGSGLEKGNQKTYTFQTRDISCNKTISK